MARFKLKPPALKPPKGRETDLIYVLMAPEDAILWFDFIEMEDHVNRIERDWQDTDDFVGVPFTPWALWETYKLVRDEMLPEAREHACPHYSWWVRLHEVLETVIRALNRQDRSDVAWTN